MTRDVSLTNRDVGAVFRRTSNSGLAQWMPNYGVWVKCDSETADNILRAIRLGSDIRFNEVDEATGRAAARALKPYPHLPVASDGAMARMYEAVVMGLPFEEARVADTEVHRIRFSGLQDDWHFLPETDRQRLVGIAVALRRRQN